MKHIKSLLDNLLSGIIDLIFSENKKVERWLILLIFIGAILRLIAALNLGVLPDDMIKASQSAMIINSKVLSTSSAPPLFYYLTDLAYSVFGYTTFASRFWPFIFGTLLIPLIFLITTKLFNKKIGLFSAFFVTFSNFIITMTFTEESLVVLFFSMFATYFGLEYLDKRKYYFIILSGILFGLAALTKYSAPFFIISFMLFILYYFKINNEKISTKQNIKTLLLFVFLILFFCIPFFAFNYFIYKDKGILDVYFSRIIRTEASEQLYGGLGGQKSSFINTFLTPALYTNPLLFFKADFLIYIFSLLGLFYIFKNKHAKPMAFLLIFLLVPFILQSGGSALQKHFVFIPFLFSIPAGCGLYSIYNKINKKSINSILLALIALIMIFNLGTQYVSSQNYFSRSADSSLKSFINKNVGEGDLIVFDPRIYTSQYFWLGTPYHFLSFHQFIDFYSYNENLSKDYKTLTKVYVIECAKDDCGWGTIKNQPDFNSSSENILEALKKNSQQVASINFSDYLGNELLEKTQSINKYNVYLFYLDFNPEVLEQTDYVNSFYFTPYLYKNMKNYAYSYNLTNSFEIFIEKSSLFIIKLSIFLSFLSILLIFYLILDSTTAV